jgi:2'-5' RNA ligase
MRLFVGIPPSAAAVSELTEALERLPRGGTGMRRLPPANWHLTLQFLGTATEQQFACVVEALGWIQVVPFSITLDGLEGFLSSGVFIASALTSPEMVALRNQILQTTASCGFVQDSRPFQPHLTLMRSRGRERAGLRRLLEGIREQPRLTPFVATEFVLYESLTHTGGAEYVARRRYPLAAD